MSGIQSSQTAASSEGTRGRNNVHSSFKKIRLWGTILVVVFLALFLWRSDQKLATGRDNGTAPLSAEEQKRRLTRERQEAEVAVVQAEAAAAARIAAERASEESLTTAKVGPCIARYTNQLNCQTVVFGQHTKYDRMAKKGYCIVSDPVDALKRTDLGGDQYRYQGKAGLTAQFFDLAAGQSTGTFKCGG
jgi:hypothetical protein